MQSRSALFSGEADNVSFSFSTDIILCRHRSPSRNLIHQSQSLVARYVFCVDSLTSKMCFDCNTRKFLSRYFDFQIYFRVKETLQTVKEQRETFQLQSEVRNLNALWWGCFVFSNVSNLGIGDLVVYARVPHYCDYGMIPSALQFFD